MHDYKAIFDGIEITLLNVASQNMPKERVQAELDEWKHLEGKHFTDDEIYRKLVHITFYSGFRANTVTEKIPTIDHHFPDYRLVAEYGAADIQRIMADIQMIRHLRKIKACVENARRLKTIVERRGSFQAFIDSLPKPESAADFMDLRDTFCRTFEYLGPRTAFHFMMDIGIPVLKPDRVIERIFKRIGVVREDLPEGDRLYAALLQAGQQFAAATGHPIRYIDMVFVCYGQVQAEDVGINRGICLSEEQGGPNCKICGANSYCEYFSRRQNAARA